MVNEIISAVLQILVFACIPFLVYLIKKKSAKGFFNYIGLKKAPAKANLYALLVALLLAMPLLLLAFANDDFRAIMTNPASVTGKIRQMGIGLNTVMIIILAAVFKTSLSEEIFFRGFVAKRLIALTNFRVGNMLQAIIFGIIHTLLFMSITSNIFFLTVIFVFPAVGAYCMAYLNEKLAHGSIIPGWISHGTANLLSYTLVLFI